MVGNKQHIRASLLRRRKALPPEKVRRWSRSVRLRALTLPGLESARRVALYRDVRNEVSTGGLYRKLHRLRKTVVYPRVTSGGLKFFRVGRLGELRIGYAGIPEPPARGKDRVDLRSIEFFFVPGVAFDRKGYRLGYGRGYYDRVLDRRRRASTACGLCFDFQLRDELPRRPHDRPVDLIVTEREVIRTHA